MLGTVKTEIFCHSIPHPKISSVPQSLPTTFQFLEPLHPTSHIPPYAHPTSHVPKHHPMSHNVASHIPHPTSCVAQIPYCIMFASHGQHGRTLVAQCKDNRCQKMEKNCPLGTPTCVSNNTEHEKKNTQNIKNHRPITMLCAHSGRAAGTPHVPPCYRNL